MKRWDCGKRQSVESAKVDAFITEIAEVCKRHGMVLAHEDTQGAFVVGAYDESTIKWIGAACIGADLSSKGGA